MKINRFLRKKNSFYAFNTDDYYKMVTVWDEENPLRLQKKIIFIAAKELA